MAGRLEAAKWPRNIAIADLVIADRSAVAKVEVRITVELVNEEHPNIKDRTMAEIEDMGLIISRTVEVVVAAYGSSVVTD